MTTMTHDSPPTRTSFRYPTLGALIIAAAFAFMLGRASASRGGGPGATPATPAAAPAASGPADLPPWCRQGFRDEAPDQACLTPDCNG